MAFWRRRFFISLLILGFIGILCFPLFRQEHSRSAQRCAYDGAKIDSLYEVQFLMKGGEVLRFCSIACALQALEQRKEGIGLIMVTDEVSGQKVDAEKTFFVESKVISVPHVKSNVHAFASEEASQRHQNQYQGKSISNPFGFFDLWREEMIGNQRVKIKIDRLSGLPRIVRGLPSVMVLKDFDSKGLNEQGAWKILTTLLSLFKHYLDLDVQEFKLIDMQRVESTWYISFWQTYGGVIIYESSLGFSIGPKGDIPSIGLLLHKAHKELHLPTRAKLSLKEATAIAKAYLRKSEPWEHNLLAYQLIIYPMKREGKVDYYLAYILNLVSPEDRVVGSSRIGWACFVDAVTGQIVDAHYMLAIPNCCEFISDNEK